MKSLANYSKQIQLNPATVAKTAERWPLLTEPQQTALAISIQCSTTLIARLANSITGVYKETVKLNEYVADLTPATAMNAPGVPLSQLRRYDEASYFKTIAMVLTRAIEQLNATNTLTNNQITDLTVRISKRFYYLKLDELLYVIQQATDGRYGRDFNRIDTTSVFDWITRYDVEERSPLVVAESTAPVDIEKAPKLDDEGLKAFHERVAAGEKTQRAPEPKRYSDDRTKQNEARARYLREKSAGIVQDYSTPNLTYSDNAVPNAD